MEPIPQFRQPRFMEESGNQNIAHYNDHMQLRNKAGLFLVITLYCLFLQMPITHAQIIGAFGAMGDSNTDEFRADDNRGGAYAGVTFNWLEQLVKSRSMNFGPWGTWGGVRRSGYQYNFARSGATTASLISENQHTQLAMLVENGSVQYVYMAIGYNDFAQYNTTDGYPAIYNGTLSGSALDNKIQKMLINIETAVTTITTSGKAKMMIATIPNPENNASVVQNFPDPIKRQRVTDAVQKVNAGIISLAANKQVAVFNLDIEFQQILNLYIPLGYIPVGTEKILFTSGDEPHHAFLGDSIHIGTVMSGIYANTLIKKMNSIWSTNITPMTDEEILANAGITGNVTPTVTTSVSPTSDSCTLKYQGDADCSGLINLVDFEIWRKEFMKTLSTLTSDFNAGGSVDIVDFEIWRKSYLQ